MAPNISTSENNGDMHHTAKNSKERKEIYYRGYFYDITDFIHRHPGGNVIKFYTEQGEDATQAIEQFHFRSWNKVETILKSFSKRLADPTERGYNTQALSRHEAITADFNKLFDEVKADGYFEPSIPHVIIRLVEPVAVSLVALAVFFECQTMLTKFLATIFCGFAMSRFGWVQHEAGHNSLTGRPKLDKLIQSIVVCLLTGGGSPMWWNSQHNRHHAMPQRLEHDVDLSTLPYIAFHKRTVKNSKEIKSFFVRYQAIFYFTLDLFVAHIAWRFVVHPRYQIRKRAYHEMLLSLPSIFYSLFVIGIAWYYVMMYWMFFFLALNFALSHSHLDVADKPTHWVEYSLTHTANIQPSLFVDYFMGYLNYQIEHHLFPTMPQFRQRQLCQRVKALAQKHGLPYRVYSYTEACALAIKNLDNVGRELTEVEPINAASSVY